MVVMATKPPPAATQPAPTQLTSAAPAPTQGTTQQDTSSAPVSPDNVGRLFVQQYYTVLNKAPHLLHRFYTKGSSFVHGKVDRDGNAEEPVYGQNEIYLKIMTLDFRECYAKIRQVDSYATLGEGVVVQVTGELSTHGKPMRRFTQTFVLAPHSARNYYVRNDIFRYHDEVFQEAEEEEEEEVEEDRVESDEETVESPADKQDSEDGEEEDRDGPSQPLTIPASAAPISSALLHQTHTAPIMPQNTLLASQQTPVAQTGSLSSHTPPIPPQEPSTFYNQPQSTVSNGLEPSPGGTPPKVQQHQLDSRLEEDKADEHPSGPPLQDIATPPVGPSPPPEEDLQNDKPQLAKEPPPAAQENKIFSWADRVQGGPKTTPQPALQTVSAAPQQPKPAADSFGGPPRGGSEALPQRAPRKGRAAGGSWPRRGPDAGEGDRAPRGPPGRIFSDKQQLFVGNLPQDIKDEELKEFFSKYGKVVEMRINRNSNPTLPFFGFIVFDEPGPVQNILELRRKQPIQFRDGYRLNVEEKKPKDPRQRINRPNSGPPPRGGPSGRGRGGGPGMGGPPRMGRGFAPQR